MNKKMEFYIDISDFPETRNFYETLRSFLTDKEKIKMFYNLSQMGNGNIKKDLKDQSSVDIMKRVSFGLSFQTDRVKITMTFN
jgi:hypothetical protein